MKIFYAYAALISSVFFLITLSAALQPETDESAGVICMKADTATPLPVDDDDASVRSRFRPVNRRFPDRIRQPHRHRQSKGIFHAGENSDFADPIPPRWGKLRRRYHAAADDDVWKFLINRRRYNSDDGFGTQKKPKFTRKQFSYENEEQQSHSQDRRSFMETVRKLFNSHF
ncbi:hypothetical protein M569_15294 [Genlisea aurea]|uniref:Uncharacterized protein n=1 Tax=Genlisea aurea TaxID=192259 RepID=S8BY39_9LAMI|nr:hypothetical protein M569_15294 [Genlisea aurea]